MIYAYLKIWPKIKNLSFFQNDIKFPYFAKMFCSRRKVERENKKKALAKQIMEQVQAIKELETTTPNSKSFWFYVDQTNKFFKKL